MKKLFLISLFFTLNTWATCNSPISRTNNSANTVLESSKYNNDHNTAYTKINDLEGSCITDGTVTEAKLDTSTLAPMTRGIQRGCEVTRASASSLSVDDCLLSINGNQLQTATATTISFGCGGCAAEATATSYFIYAKSTSDGSTLELTIETGAPADSTGYDSSNNLVLGRFYNNSSGDIDQYSIDQYRVNQFVSQSTGWVNGGSITFSATTTPPTKGSTARDRVFWRRVGDSMEMFIDFEQTSTGSSGSGSYLIEIANGQFVDTTVVDIDTDLGTAGLATNVIGYTKVTSVGTIADSSVKIYNSTHLVFHLTGIGHWGSAALAMGAEASLVISFIVIIPIEGWVD